MKGMRKDDNAAFISHHRSFCLSNALYFGFTIKMFFKLKMSKPLIHHKTF